MSGRGGTPAIVAAQRAGIPHRVHEFVVAPGEPYGPAAAAALGIDAARVFKTLVVSAELGGSARPTLAVALVPVEHQLSLKAMASALGAKRVTLAEAAMAERTTGYVVGGISPLGQKRLLPTVADRSLLEPATVYVSAGRRGLELELAGADLVRLLHASVADLTGSSGAPS